MDLKTKASANRIEWVDMAKGMTMLLVIVAHTMSGSKSESILRGLIYSFHMPLFFILSGLTMSTSQNLRQYLKRIVKSAKGLLIPGICLYLSWVLIELCRGQENMGNPDFWKGKLLTLLFASASSTVWGETFIAGIGMIWFFFVLYFGKLIYDGMYLFLCHILSKSSDTKIQYAISGVSLLLAIAGIYFGHFRWLPFSFDVALGIQPFFVMGMWLKKIDLQKRPFLIFVTTALTWLLTFYITYPNWETSSYLEVGLRKYSLFPISYISALCGTLSIGLFNIALAKIKLAQSAFTCLGKNSMYLLCIHIMDQLWDFIWYREGNAFLSTGLRLGSDLAMFALIMMIIFLIKKAKGRSVLY